MMTQFALVLAVILGTHSALAQKDNVEREIKKCHKEAKSTADMHECLAKEFSYHDAKLNKVYSEIRAEHADGDSSSKEITRRLIMAQRAWINFRDANCGFESSSNLGGTAEGLVYHSCVVRMTKERAKQLQEQRVH